VDTTRLVVEAGLVGCGDPAGRLRAAPPPAQLDRQLLESRRSRRPHGCIRALFKRYTPPGSGRW